MNPVRKACRARAGLPPADVRRVEDLERLLATFHVDRPDELEFDLEQLRELLDASRAAVYQPQRQAHGWGLGLSTWVGFADTDVGDALSRYFSNVPYDFTRTGSLYDPDRPEPRQRNRAVLPFHMTDPGRIRDTPHFVGTCLSIGIGDMDQVRVLVCDGPALLGWVGAMRRDPFTLREQRRLAALVPALYKRLRVERRLRDADLYGAGLEAALEALPVPAFVVRPNGSVAHANESGRAAYTASLGAALAEGSADGYEATAISVRGASAASLLVRSAAARDLGARVSASARAWKLTRRQSEVLALVALGDSNKLIAAKLGCALRTVEVHVTALLRKAGCDSRAELVASLSRRAAL